MDTFGPHYFLDQNIIVVSIQYRLGPLGFLSTVDDIIPGNLGIKDQQLAMKWVSKRIKHFGGDPSRITLMGQSAGAMSVGYHLMNPQNRGLFSGAIMQSGSPLSCAALQKFPRDAAFLMAAAIDESLKTMNSSEELLTFLQETPLDVLKNASFVKLPTTKLNCQFVGSLTWVPTRESPEARKPIIMGMNYEKIKKGMTLKIPLLIGINSQESIYYGMDGLDLLAKMYDINPSYLISGNLNINHKQRCAAGQALKYIYTNSSFSSDISKLIEFNSDTYFNVPTLTFAYYHAQHSDVYAYRFAFKGMLGNQNSTFPGVGHAEDLNYIFQNSENENLSNYSNEEVITHNRIIELWSQFIKYRNPTKHTNDLLQNVNWTKFTQNKFVHLNIDENLSVGQFKSTFKEWINIISRFASPFIDTF
ncbi:unnamed protein product [Psylliodes chrysocephalus]|uniref:Carboxylic ester hydrolase n=1 Tax=Psylliodes chrysocephalus TaxID=3402493 RepID=A0A9P0G466_9CUCU|nr:unnamed protein product [Psylliodes chrysocephala]